MIMPNWRGIVGTSFTPVEFNAYCRSLCWDSWRPSFIVLHHTESLSLEQCPNGLTRDHILKLESYYRDKLGLRAGPHLFVDDRCIWVFTPLNVAGAHSPSWNNISLGVAMLGDYDKESFHTGRGLDVRKNTVSAIATLCTILEIDCHNLLLHREDPVVKDVCPGSNVQSLQVIREIRKLIAGGGAGLPAAP
jgi:N-acetylmuramoyl-L-alanine amidase